MLTLTRPCFAIMASSARSLATSAVSASRSMSPIGASIIRVASSATQPSASSSGIGSGERPQLVALVVRRRLERQRVQLLGRNRQREPALYVDQPQLEPVAAGPRQLGRAGALRTSGVRPEDLGHQPAPAAGAGLRPRRGRASRRRTPGHGRSGWQQTSTLARSVLSTVEASHPAGGHDASRRPSRPSRCGTSARPGRPSRPGPPRAARSWRTRPPARAVDAAAYTS